uniref:ABC transporter domain-containing protein n=2 Tax=Lotharella globosa TaxID=91324 RepID=A0A7S3YWF6_9EUKA
MTSAHPVGRLASRERLTYLKLFQGKYFPKNLKEIFSMLDSNAVVYMAALSLVGTSVVTLSERWASMERASGEDADTPADSAKTPRTRVINLLKILMGEQPKKPTKKSEESKENANVDAKEKGPPKKKKKKKKPAIDMRFLRRLRKILKIVIPTWDSREVFLLIVQTILLVTRSLISIHTAKVAGMALKIILERSPRLFWSTLTNFAITGAAASLVNSGLKFLTNAITVAFRERLTRYVHQRYMANRNYYKAAVLKGGQLDNPDQRVVEDLLKFCETVSDLFSRTFKPFLDVVVSTMKMAEKMGYFGPLVMYSYFFLAAQVVRGVSPNFPSMIAQKAKIEGDFRRGHTRIIQHAEEIAFLGGEKLEKKILNDQLSYVSEYSSKYFFKQFLMGIFDQWSFKYMASCVGMPLVVFPFLIRNSQGGAKASDLASGYYETNILIQQASGSLSDLMLVYKKFQKLAGYTARVMELIEAIEAKETEEEGTTMEDNQSEKIGFNKVSIYAPDGRLLLKDLTLDIQEGVRLMITGINGAGKTSLFRVLSGLWKGRGGVIMRPDGMSRGEGKIHLFYMPQNPYLVSGNLRDQVSYPRRLTDNSRDGEICELLRKVGLGKFLNMGDTKGHALSLSHHDWSDVLSGGEKQRVGWARLFFHKPKFAILDEATSAINPDEEGKLHQELIGYGVTFFSIAHRMDLRRFHQKELRIFGDGTGGWELTEITAAAAKGH